MVLAISIIVFLLVGLLIVGFGYKAYARPARVLEQLSNTRASVQSFDSLGGTPIAPDNRFEIKTALQWLGEKVPLSPHDSSLTRRLLSAAGYRKESALPIFVGIRLGLATLGVIIAALAALTTDMQPIWKLASLAIAGFIGFWLPGMVLQEIFIPAYQEKIRFALPDALDMLVICVESGISLDQALRLVSEELMLTHPELCRELNLVSVEMRAGLRRQQALKNLAQRTLEPELGKLVAMLIQTDRFGTSIGDALRTHSEFMRVRRRQDAEERAGKLGVKLIFPIFFLIMPAIFLVTVGPALISLQRTPLFGGS